MLELGVEAVVLRRPAPGAVDVDVEVRVRLAAGHGGVVRGVLEGLGDVDPHEQVVPLAPDVVQLGDGVLRHLALDAEGPLVDVGVPGLRGHAHGEERVGGGRGDAPATAKLGNNWSVVLNGVVWSSDLRVVAPAHVGIDVRRAVDLAPLGRVVEASEAAADDGLLALARTVGEAQARSEDLVSIRVVGAAAAGRLVVGTVVDPLAPAASGPPRAGRPGRSSGCASPCGRSSRRARCGSRSAGRGST